jgi:hypothetical protein|nr:MAG TPA: apelin receptor protein [Caudoviricetes sp.]
MILPYILIAIAGIVINATAMWIVKVLKEITK